MEKLGETSIQLKVWEEEFAFQQALKMDCDSSESVASSSCVLDGHERDNSSLHISTE